MFKGILAAGLTLTLIGAAPVFAQNADPTIDQVSEAARAGHFAEAQTMMQRVLRDHPDSAKAHYVEAELQARQGQYSAAASELQTAQRLAPGLPFVRPQSVSELERVIAQGSGSGNYQRNVAVQAPRSGFGVGGMILLLIGVGVIFLIIALVRATRRVVPVAGAPMGYMNPGAGMGMGGGMPVYPMGGMPMGGGMGSGILGGLATGAALGAGVVAGEELMHHVLDPSHPNYVPPSDQGLPIQDNMGGQDFGINDAGSWDNGGSSLSDGFSSGDSGGGGGGDWT
jgi:hypothetical protein